MMDMETLKAMGKPENIILTEHARLRLFERGIKVADIVHCIKTGEIIEKYEQAKPFPSCLVLGMDVNQVYIHVVVSCGDNFIHLITAYYPEPAKWDDGFKRRKEHIL